MIQILSPGWWLSFADVAWPWWLACSLAGVLALPLCLRLFRGLSDGGAGLSPGVGLVAITWIAWLGSLTTEGRGLWVRAILVVAGLAVAASGWRGPRSARPRFLAASAPLVIAGVLKVAHGGPWILTAALLFGLSSFGLWWGDGRRLKRAVGATLVPFLASQALFLAGFLYFTNVRSYVPYATFDVGLSGAEKLGNLMHLNSALRATTFPPGDAWLLGETTNYYYVGHLLVATVAKATGTPARLAFNLGLAMFVGLTLAMGSSLAYGVAVPRRRAARRRVDALRVAGLRIVRHRGLAWGLLGALAIALFGNLDAWRQLGARHTPDRWTVANLKQVDYWKSSRAIHGAPANVTDDATITEFPYFSALLGDLHPHHMALPYTLAALAGCAAVLRLSRREKARETAWFRRTAPALVAMALFWGGVIPVNTWDAIVLAVLYLLVVVLSRRGLDADRRWALLARVAGIAAATWLVALAANAGRSTPWLFASATGYAAAVLVAGLGPSLLRSRAPASLRSRADLVGLSAGALVLILAAAPDLAAALRDAVAFLFAASLASGLVARGGPPLLRATASLGTVGAVFAVAGLFTLPFMAFFKSPLDSQAPLFTKVVPPVLSTNVVRGEGSLVTRLWAASPINPFPAELRTTLGDGLAHWGLFVLPVAVFLGWRLRQKGARQPEVVGIAAGLLLVSVAGYIVMGYWVGPLAIALAAGCAALAFGQTEADDRPALLFAATSFFWMWFVEALHFDDSYGGVLERYNTPFKIFYPVWPMMAAAMVAALRRLSPPVPASRLPLALVRSPGTLFGLILLAAVTGATLGAGDAVRVTLVVGTGAILLAWVITTLRRTLENRFRGPAPAAPSPKKTKRGTGRRPAAAEAPALVAGLAVCALGFLYPFAATAVRTRSFFSEPIEGTWMADPNGERDPAFYTTRTLDGFAWLGQTKRYRSDLPAIEWLNAHAPAGAVVLEAPAEGAYSPSGRVASMTGLPTFVGWKHHENQWRGWGKPMPAGLRRRLLEEFLPQLPALGPALGTLEPTVRLDRGAEIALYQASAEGDDVLRQRLRDLAPSASGARLSALAAAVVKTRDQAMTAIALTDKLYERASTLYRSPVLSGEIRRLLDFYGVQYVFVGAVERETFPPEGLAKFEALPRLFANDGAAIYCASAAGCS